jgi:CRISPR system Cascade subunit CasA
MNLLTDKWIPVQKEGKRDLIRLQDVLCKDEAWPLSLPRDDMEMACLQLIICLTQVIFTPENTKTLRLQGREPMSEEEYQQGISDYLNWFDLNHLETPFMQVRGVKAVKATPIQKLFVGLPEGNNHCFFNDAGELKAVSQSAAAIALFNQAMNSPSMGGGFKGGFRGNAPVTTLIYGENLRQTVWFNVLHEDSLRLLMPEYDKLKSSDVPVWVEPIKAKSSISASSIGLLRGLFWQPAHIELIYSDAGCCQFYGSHEDHLVTGFNKEKFVYEIIGQWVHPHSPRYWQLKKGAKEEKYVSFTTTAPAWTHLSRFIVDRETEKEGQQPAAVVSQRRRATNGKPLNLMVGGYRNKQASILQRRHELLALSGGWEEHLDPLKETVEAAIQVKTALRGKLYGFAKASGASAVPDQAEALFYRNSEDLIHENLRPMDWREVTAAKKEMVQKLIRLSWDIFERAIKPYQHEPKMILAIAVAKRSLGKEFKKIQGGQV